MKNPVLPQIQFHHLQREIAHQSLKHHPLDSESNKLGEELTTDASLGPNHFSVLCLALVSEGLKLVWAQAEDLDDVQELGETLIAFFIPKIAGGSGTGSPMRFATGQGEGQLCRIKGDRDRIVGEITQVELVSGGPGGGQRTLALVAWRVALFRLIYIHSS
ncbi:zinc fingers and homeoboxes protein 1-like [Arapaima gigas]